MTKTLFTVSLWALAGFAIGSWIGPHTGWAIFAFGLFVMVIVSGLQVSRVTRWAKNIDSPPPVAVGPWDDILSLIYRKLRKDRQVIERQEQDMLRMLEAAEALPDGAITLDGQMQLTWVRSAREHLDTPQSGRRSQHFQYSSRPRIRALCEADRLGRALAAACAGP